MKFTSNEMQRLQVGQVAGPYLATRKDIHRVQANIYNYKKKWVGADFKSKSVQAKRLNTDGNVVRIEGWYEFSIKRISCGVSPITGEEETIL